MGEPTLRIDIFSIVEELEARLIFFLREKDMKHSASNAKTKIMNQLTCTTYHRTSNLICSLYISSKC